MHKPKIGATAASCLGKRYRFRNRQNEVLEFVVTSTSDDQAQVNVRVVGADVVDVERGRFVNRHPRWTAGRQAPALRFETAAFIAGIEAGVMEML